MNPLIIPIPQYRFYLLILLLSLGLMELISIFAPYLAQLLSNTETHHSVELWLLKEIWTPRTLVAIGAGAALALSGAIFQSLTKNPLGSPDIIGINAGASAGAVAVTLIWPAILPITVGAFLGALSALLLILFAQGNDRHFGFKVIVSGIAVNAFALALVQFGLTGVRQEDAYQLSIWLSGTLAQRTWLEVSYLMISLPILALLLIFLQRALLLMELGNDTAHSLGISIRKNIWLNLILATTLSTIAVISAGPISFLALAAPHITKSLFRRNQLLLLPTAMTGACLLLLADLLTRALPAAFSLPVGIVTAALGGIYLCFLLLKTTKR